jgi:phage gpG-like protein
MSDLIEIRGTVIGAETVVGRLSVLYPERALQRLRDAVRALGFLLERKVKLEKLSGQVLKRQSGRLVRSVNTKFVDTNTSSTAIVGTSLKYARIWELTGSREFTIVPVNKRALYWPGAPHPVASVTHPAQAPRPFLKPALAEMRPTIRATLERAMHNLGAA